MTRCVGTGERREESLPVSIINIDLSRQRFQPNLLNTIISPQIELAGRDIPGRIVPILKLTAHQTPSISPQVPGQSLAPDSTTIFKFPLGELLSVSFRVNLNKNSLAAPHSQQQLSQNFNLDQAYTLSTCLMNLQINFLLDLRI